MLWNYIKITARNIRKYKIFSIVNFLGLALGLACCILIMLWVIDETGYDKFNKNADNLYRLSLEYHNGDNVDEVAVTPGPMGPMLQAKVPQVINHCRIVCKPWTLLVSNGRDSYYENTIAFCDSTVFDMFDYKLLEGDPTSALAEPNTVVIDRDLAKKYFGNSDALGQTIKMLNRYELKITGVMEPIPTNSHLQFKALVNFEFLKNFRFNVDNWGDNSFYTYVQVQDAKPETLEPVFTKLVAEAKEDETTLINVMPITSIHLHSHLIADNYGNGDIRNIYIFSIIAMFVLLIACINFVNLSTARAIKRAKEVGLRKVLGANRSQLIKQFMGETMVLSCASLALALILVEIFLPTFNNLVGKSLSLNSFGLGGFIVIMIGIAAAVGVFSGIYPALVLSSFAPSKILKGSSHQVSSGAKLRKVLVVVQFSLSIMLIVGTVVVYQQVQYMTHKNLGFDKDQMVYMLANKSLQDNYELVRDELLKSDYVLAVTGTQQLPNDIAASTDGVDWEGRPEELDNFWYFAFVKPNFIDVFDMKLVEGRNFSDDFSTDSSSYIVNETAAKLISSESVIGKRFALWHEDGKIIGVLKDYHFQSLHSKIEPLIYKIDNNRLNYICAKLSGKDIPGALGYMKKAAGKFAPEFPFEYKFLDDTIEAKYRSDMQVGTILRYFTFLAIVIACLGIFGLTSFTIEQRKKEIGIRKVLGASEKYIVAMLCRELVILVLAANLIAIPLAWYFISNWLKNFAYHISLGWSVFVFGAILAVVVALLTVSYQSIKAAWANPVEALKHE